MLNSSSLDQFPQRHKKEARWTFDYFICGWMIDFMGIIFFLTSFSEKVTNLLEYKFIWAGTPSKTYHDFNLYFQQNLFFCFCI